MALRDVVEVEGEHVADAERAGALARGVDVVELEHQHVPAVAAAALDPPPGSGVRAHRRDDLEEAVAEREDGVPEPEGVDARVRERLTEAQLLAKAVGDGVELGRGQYRLPETQSVRPHVARLRS